MSALPEPPADRFCDLVMKGGITSGVVYPGAIGLLARQYRFKNIGGTSAGAIAAAVTAAAEYQRRQPKGSRDGFLLLETLPAQLKTTVGGGLFGSEKSKLLSLFQPQRGTHRLFAVLIASLNSGSTYRRIGLIGYGFLKAYWPVTLLVAALGAAVVYVAAAPLVTLLALLLLLLVLLPLGIGIWVYLDLTRQVVKNGYGMCTGMDEGGRPQALTPWLHDLIQRAAGRTASDAPLTFGELWDAPGFPPAWMTLPAGAKPRSIDLQMFTTNLAHGRPYVFPLGEPLQRPGGKASRFRSAERLFFSPAELKPYLPERVMAWMLEHGKPYTVEPGREGRDPSVEAARDLLTLPEPRRFPVLLAARMSLSFPLLFAAVPLWAIDHDLPPGQRTFRRCWFSDGGISSNFPMHLFDGLVPMWPTFGITLEPTIKGQGDVFLPQRYEQGYGERWTRFDEKPDSAGRFGGFLGAVVSTMQNWNDNALARMPGVRDRVARVRLTATEGGMNLNMPPKLIDKVARKGEDAAAELITRFAQRSASGAQAAGWDEHRLVRLGVFLKLLEARAPSVLMALGRDLPHATDFSALLAQAMHAEVAADGKPNLPPGFETVLTPAQHQALVNAMQAVAELSRTLVEPGNGNAFQPVPSPELRVRPAL